MIAVWELLVFRRLPSEYFGTTGLQDTGTLSSGHLRVGVPFFVSCFWCRFVFLTPLFDTSISPRAMRLSQVFYSHSLVSRFSVFLDAATLVFNVPVRLLASTVGGSRWPSGPPGGIVCADLGIGLLPGPVCQPVGFFPPVLVQDTRTSLILLSPLFSKITFYPRFFVLAFFLGNPRFFQKRGVKKSSLFSSPSAFLKVHLGVNGRRLNLQMHT